MTANGIDAFLDVMGPALEAFAAGSPEPYKALWSKLDDVTILGAFGGLEQSWSNVGPRLDWASEQFHDGVHHSDHLSTLVADQLTCLVSIERIEARVGSSPHRTLTELRVTHVLRLEEGRWRVIHRHADPLLSKCPPT